MSFFRRLLGDKDEERFAKLILAEIRKTAPSVEADYDKGDFSITLKAEGSSNDDRLFLDNAFAAFRRADKEERNEIVRRFAGLANKPEIPKSLVAGDTGFVPRIRSRSYWEILSLHWDLEGNESYKPDLVQFNDLLQVSLAYDSDDYIGESFLPIESEYGVPAETAFEIAYDNLRRSSQEPFQLIESGLYASPWMDNHDASRLVLSELFHRLELRGEPVAMVPNRDTLFVTGAEDRDGLLTLAQVAQSEIEHERLILGDLFKLNGEQWHPFTLEGTHPAAESLGRLKRSADAVYYRQQAELLDLRDQKNGLGVFNASFEIYENQGRQYSFCVWSKGVDSLLPESELVALVRQPEQDSSEYIVVPWPQVSRVSGELLEPTDIFPPRWRVQDFPDDEHYAELSQHQIALDA